MKKDSNYFINEFISVGRKNAMKINLGPHGCDAPMNILQLECNFDFLKVLRESFRNHINTEFTIIIPKDFKISYIYDDYNVYNRTLKYYKDTKTWK